MLGRILNSHQQWLCRRLADLGYVVTRQVAVADTSGEIQKAVQEALARADLVITTGGLGPTSDDLTREALARLLGRTLREDAAVVAHIRNYFKRRNYPMPESARVQALVPEGALVLPNPNGTAPGLAIKVERNADASFKIENAGGTPPDPRSPAWLVMLPGPPRELQPMFIAAVEPLLRREFPLASPFFCRTLRTSGVGESVLEEKIREPLRELVKAGLEIGYCARIGQVDVRLAAFGANAEETVAAAEAIVRATLGADTFGTGDEELEAVVIRLLTAQKKSLAVAESCTGGWIANRLTNVPGASAVFRGGFVTYSNEAKEKFLGVRAETLARHGAVSEAVAREMAEGARRAMGSDYAIAVTGIAGPDGGSAEKPVGTVYFALAEAGATRVWQRLNAWDRLTFKEVTAAQALNQLRLRLG